MYIIVKFMAKNKTSNVYEGGETLGIWYGWKIWTAWSQWKYCNLNLIMSDLNLDYLETQKRGKKKKKKPRDFRFVLWLESAVILVPPFFLSSILRSSFSNHHTFFLYIAIYPIWNFRSLIGVLMLYLFLVAH